MEVSRIEETNRTSISHQVDSLRSDKRICLYYAHILCRAPKLRFKICQGCPRLGGHVRKNAVKFIFSYIKSFSIHLVKSLNIQSSK